MAGSLERCIRRSLTAVIRTVVLLLLLGCADPSDSEHTLVVFAASSLTDAFTELERDYERAHPDVDVRMVFAGSQVLRLQIEQGAQADVVATADESHLRALHDAGLVNASQVFAHNELVVLVPMDSPIERFDQLVDAERVVLGTDAVPVGIYAREVIARAGISLRIVSEESNVRLVRAKVELGEADAAFVYRTDVHEGARAIPIPERINARATYSIARVTSRGGRWIEFVLSESGQAVLQRHGFTR